MATIQDQFNARQAESESRIKGLYDKEYDTKRAELQSAYDRNLSDLTAQRDKIGKQYQAQANALAGNYEQNRRNMNLQAMNEGLGTGTAVQQQNALNTKFMQNYGAIRGNELAANATANQNITNLTNEYRNNLANAKAQSDLNANAAVIKDYNKQMDWRDEQAKLLAGYGDFSGYETMYGKEQSDAMRNLWIAQNPDLAYRSGQISKEDYQKITGKAPTYESYYKNF